MLFSCSVSFFPCMLCSLGLLVSSRSDLKEKFRAAFRCLSYRNLLPNMLNLKTTGELTSSGTCGIVPRLSGWNRSVSVSLPGTRAGLDSADDGACSGPPLGTPTSPTAANAQRWTSVGLDKHTAEMLEEKLTVVQTGTNTWSDSLCVWQQRTNTVKEPGNLGNRC